MKIANVVSLVIASVCVSAWAAEPAAPPKDDPKQAAAQSTSSSAAQANPAVRTSGPARSDRLDLDTTVVTGNRELPKVLYIVPWKKSDIGDLPAQPFNTLLDEVLTPVDRDVFRREVTYYEAVSDGSDATPAATPTTSARPEK